MAKWVIRATSTLRGYGTSKQAELLAMLNNDPKVHKHINEILNDMMREGDYIPMNMSEFPSRNAGDYPGRLRDSVLITENGITWRTPYARYVWGGIRYHTIRPMFKGKTLIGFRSYSAPNPKGPKALKYSVTNAGPNWVSLAFAGSGRNINNAITNYLKRECKKRGLNQ